MFKTTIIDNCIPLKNQKLIISKMITEGYFPWYYLEDVTDGNKQKTKQFRPSLGHVFIKNKKENSDLTKVITDMFSSFFSFKNIINCRSLLQFPLNQNLLTSKYDTPHVDSPDPHVVYLYYVIDADGCTVLFKNSKVIKKITPKQGTLVIFDGSVRHTAEQPKKGMRCIINFNIEKNEL
jgi:hypothetical protein